MKFDSLHVYLFVFSFFIQPYGFILILIRLCTLYTQNEGMVAVQFYSGIQPSNMVNQTWVFLKYENCIVFHISLWVTFMNIFRVIFWISLVEYNCNTTIFNIRANDGYNR